MVQRKCKERFFYLGALCLLVAAGESGGDARGEAFGAFRAVAVVVFRIRMVIDGALVDGFQKPGSGEAFAAAFADG